MADELKIRVGVDGAQRAQSDLKGVSRAEQDVGATAKKAGKDAAGAKREAAAAGKQVKRSAEDGREAIDKLGGSIGLNVRALTNWRLGIAAALMAIIELFRRSMKEMTDFRKSLRDTYREFVDLSQQPGTVQLAQLRGASEADTALWAVRQAKEYGIAPEAAREAAFAIESGIAPEAVGGRAALGQIERAAFTTMRAYGASGGTLASLAIAGLEARQARTPQEFRAFFAKVGAYAGKSKVSMEELAQISSELLPAAISAGIDPDYFLAMAAAMSFRMPAARVRTSIERLIRAAGTPSEPLEQYATAMGKQASEMSAQDIWAFQSQFISQASQRGPQAAMQAAEALGLTAEIQQVFTSAFDPRVLQRMKGIMGAGRAAKWSGVQGRFAGVTGTPEALEKAARTEKELSRNGNMSLYL